VAAVAAATRTLRRLESGSGAQFTSRAGGVL